MHELPHFLPELDPPRGGLVRLRQSVAATQRPRGMPHRRLAWATAIILPLLLLSAGLPYVFMPRQPTSPLTVALQQALTPTLPANGLRVHDGGAVELESGQANVRLYLVETVAHPAAHGHDAKPNHRHPTPTP